MKLAQAVCLIHRHRILHRDICPRNIILKDGTDSPVLIDFGLARLSTDEMKTVISSKYTAPEISGKHPKWSDASDIYSLGATLQSLLVEQDRAGGALIEIIGACMHEQPKERPNADDLLKKMKDLLPQLHVTEQKNAASKKLESITKIDIDGNEKNAWFGKVIREKIDTIFQSVCFGLHDEVFSRCTEAAQILDFTLEGYPEESLKLTYVFNNDTKSFGNQLKGHRCIEFLSSLRIGRNHYDYRRTKEKTLKRFKEPTKAQMEEWVIDGAGRIGNVLGLQSLESLIRAVIEYGHDK
jgi:serine/threonine protein kinase